MIPRSPFFAVAICVLLFGCERSVELLLATAPNTPVVVQPTIRPGMDTAIATNIFIEIVGYSQQSSGCYTIAIASESTNDRYEPDDTRAAAAQITTDSVVQRRFMQAAEHDWIKFEAIQGKSYTIPVSLPTEVYHQDAVFEVYDEANPWKEVVSGASYVQPATYSATKSGAVRIDIHGSNVQSAMAYTASVKTK